MELFPRETAPEGMEFLNYAIRGVVESVAGPVFSVRPAGYTQTVFEFRADENEELAVNTANGRLYEIRRSEPAGIPQGSLF